MTKLASRLIRAALRYEAALSDPASETDTCASGRRISRVRLVSQTEDKLLAEKGTARIASRPMQDEFHNNLAMARRMKTFLETSANKAIWFNNPPQRFTTRAAELYPALEGFATLAAQQSVGPKGSSDQQNIHETKLEDLAHPLANALHEYYLENGQADKAAQWDMSETKWRRMREQALLGKAELLLAELTPLTTGPTPAGTDYGITAAAVTALSTEADEYGDAIGQPTARRAQRTANTGLLRPTWRKVREILEAMDRLVVQFREAAGGAAFVEGWFAARRLEDLGHGPATPPPPSPPKP